MILRVLYDVKFSITFRNKGLKAIRITVFVLALLISNWSQVYAQSNSPEWFVQKCVFPLLEYDLLEVQPYAGLMFLYPKNIDYEGLYIPVNIGFRKSFLQWDMLSLRFDLALGAAAYTQFEVIKFDRNTYRGGLLNTDFKASGFLFTSSGRNYFRVQLFHISSHLGDDYMIRNQDFELNDKSVNYEQVDITYLIRLNQVNFYIGIGQVITAHAYRKRFMAEIGFQGDFPLKEKIDLAYGADLKLYDENDFIPDYHGGLGISFKQKKQHQLNISFDVYHGNIPYSTLDFGQVFWAGLSSRVYL